MHKVWIADDDAAIRMVLEEGLKSDRLLITTFASGELLIEALNADQPDLIISDIKMPGMQGYDLLKHIKNNYEKLPVIIMTAFTDMQAAIDAYGGGAFEYIPKPFDLDEALQTINRALEENKQTAPKKISKSEIIGSATSMQVVFRSIGKLANTNATVLIQGESGTGKELVSKSLHKNSPRFDMPFIALNMADIPKELIESELFGHEKGAFTGAVEQRIGRFEQANGGTLFLDEIGDMPFNKTLQDWAKFDVNDRTKFDASISSGYAIMANQKHVYLPEKKESKISIKFATYDNTGSFSRINKI